MLCDSNILIYAADSADTLCGSFVEREDATISVVSRIEVLGFPGFGGLSQGQRDRLEEIITSLMELDLNETIVQRAIVLRRQRRMSLADAIIAGTALAHGLPLATRNVDDFKHVAGLTIINPFAPS